MSQHHHVVHEPRAPQYSTATKVVTQVVTAPAPVYTPYYYPQAQQHTEPSYAVGPPIGHSRVPTSIAPAPAPTPTPAYHAPVRHHRPQGGHKHEPKPKPKYHAPVRHHRPDGKPKPKYHAPERHHRPHPTHHDHGHHSSIGPPKSTQHRAGQPIAHAPTSAAGTSHVPIPSIDASTQHSSDKISPPNKTTTDQGMSGGAKAGLAIGILLIIGLIAGLAFYFYRKKKNQNDAHQPLDDDEKSNLHKSGSVMSHVSVRRTVANAPRLSLRPVTQMFPTMAEKQENTAAGTLIANSAASARARTPEPPKVAQNHDDKFNPFGDHAEAANTADDSTVTAPAAVVPKPLSIKSERTGTGISEGSLSTENQAAAATAAAAGAAGGKPPNGRRMSPPGPGPNNVHRVQLDFNPSMDDELGLRAGQLVRMLHEYDDGWALCVRLDRSQQGVVPRTCLSKLPVKPRPQGPPQGMRGPPPQGRPRGPTNGPAPRMPPNGRLRSQSNSPRQPRPESPGPMNGRMGGAPSPRPRANSDAMSARRITPPNMTSPSSTSTSPPQGAAVPSRKPVPGQAL